MALNTNQSQMETNMTEDRINTILDQFQETGKVIVRSITHPEAKRLLDRIVEEFDCYRPHWAWNKASNLGRFDLQVGTAYIRLYDFSE
jgi:hypothetical protein